MIANKLKYINTDFIFINGDCSGQQTRCVGTFKSEQDGRMYLDLTNGMPVPFDQVDYYLKETKHKNIASDTIDLTELKQQYEPELLEQTQEVSLERNISSYKDCIKTEENSDKNTDMFCGFSKNSIELPLKINIELPDISLIKVMYNNYGDKNEFISNFSSHILASINKDIISESVMCLLDNSEKQKRSKKTPRETNG